MNTLCKIGFGGGGFRGFAYAGVLDELRKQGIDWGQRCPHLESIFGCSIGSIISLLIVAGFSSSEIMELAKNLELSDIINTDLIQFFISPNKLGFDNGNKLRSYLTNLISKKTSAKTMLEMFNYSKIKWIICVSNITKGKMEYISHETAPELYWIDVILASCALPPIFCPVTLNGDLCADGGILLTEYPEGYGFYLKSENSLDLTSAFPIAVYLDKILRLITPKETIKEPCTIIDCGNSPMVTLNWNLRKDLIELGRNSIKK